MDPPINAESLPYYKQLHEDARDAVNNASDTLIAIATKLATPAISAVQDTTTTLHQIAGRIAESPLADVRLARRRLNRAVNNIAGKSIAAVEEERTRLTGMAARFHKSPFRAGQLAASGVRGNPLATRMGAPPPGTVAGPALPSAVSAAVGDSGPVPVGSPGGLGPIMGDTGVPSITYQCTADPSTVTVLGPGQLPGSTLVQLCDGTIQSVNSCPPGYTYVNNAGIISCVAGLIGSTNGSPPPPPAPPPPQPPPPSGNGSGLFGPLPTTGGQEPPPGCTPVMITPSCPPCPVAPPTICPEPIPPPEPTPDAELCDCIRYVGNVIKWCCEHDQWHAENGGAGNISDWPQDTRVLDDWERAEFDEETGSQLEAETLPWPGLRAFKAEGGAAVGGGTVGFALPLHPPE